MEGWKAWEFGLCLVVIFAGNSNAGAKDHASVVLIHNVTELQNIQKNLALAYALANDIDASGTVSWNSGAGFLPLGTNASPFTGVFDGAGYAINGLAINRPSTDNVALFGVTSATATVQNVRMTSVSILGNNDVGGLVGANNGTIMMSGVSGVVAGSVIEVSGPTSTYAGGLVGLNTGKIADASVSVTVSSGGAVGGLAGQNTNTILHSSAGATVFGAQDNIGGLVGGNTGTIMQSFSTGSVHGEVFDVGGLVGENLSPGEISQSYSIAAVRGDYYNTGGLVGELNGGQIVDTAALGNVSGYGAVGGLVGLKGNGAGIATSYSAGSVNGGGLIGWGGSAFVTNSYWDTDASGQTESAGGSPLNTRQMTNGTLNKLMGFNPAVWEPMRFAGVNPAKGYYPQLWALPFPITSFPLASYTPYSIPIITVFDHSLQDSPNSGVGRLYACDSAVRAFTGATGEQQYGADAKPCKQPGYKKADGKRFVLNGVNYTGTSSDGPKYLEYDGHPGFDYAAMLATPVYAAVSGTVFYPWRAIGSGDNNDTYCRFHTLGEIPDAAPAYRIYYMHLSTHPAHKGQASPDCSSIKDTDGQTVNFAAQPDCYTDIDGNSIAPTTLPLPEGTHANAGCEIALSGDAGVPGAAHLHFEIQQIVPAGAITVDPGRIAYFPCFDENKSYKKGVPGVSPYCLPADPYGWTGVTTDCSGDAQHWHDDGTDIWGCLTGIPSRRFWAQ